MDISPAKSLSSIGSKQDEKEGGREEKNDNYLEIDEGMQRAVEVAPTEAKLEEGGRGCLALA